MDADLGIRFKDKDLLEEVRNLACLGCLSLDPDNARENLFSGVRSHPHHIKTRGAGGGDYYWNVMPLCFSCHRKMHDVGLRIMADKYEFIKSWLLQADWVFDEDLGRWVHD